MSHPQHAPPRPARSPRAPLAAALASLLLLGVAGSSLAAGTRDALAADTSAQMADATNQLLNARSDYQRALAGISAELRIDPLVAYVDPRDDPATEPPGFEYGVRIGADIGYRYDRSDILANEIRLVDETLDARTAAIEAREDVLIAHAVLLQRQLDDELVRIDLERQRASRDALAGSGASAAEIRAADLTVARRAAAAADVRARLERARATLAAYGLDTAATFEVIRFQLPPREVTETLRRREAELELLRAYAERDQDTFFSVLDNVGIDLSYENPGYAIGTSIDLDEGRPGIAISADYGTPDRDSFRVALSATIAIDSGIGSRIARAEEEVADRLADLAALTAEYPEELAQRRDDAEAAWRDLEFELESIAIDEARSVEVADLLDQLPAEVAEKQAQVNTLNEAIAAAPNVTERDAARAVWQEALAELRLLERTYATVLRDAERGAAGAVRAQAGVYRAWETYLRRVGDYLVFAERGWNAATE